jgi:hypothetical protein
MSGLPQRRSIRQVSRRHRPEAQLQAAVVERLRLRARPDVLWLHCPNGERRDKITGAKLKRMGVLAGPATCCSGIAAIDGPRPPARDCAPRGGAVPERGPGHLQVLAYGQRAVLREPHQRPRGHRWHDNWMRNILTCYLIAIVDRDFDIRPSRNRERSHGKRAHALSGIGIVVRALARHGVELDETNVQENIWFGAAGEIVRADIKTVRNSIL